MVIYKATNLTNNKCYIGQTKHYKSRKEGHIKGNKDLCFGRAMLKYGNDNFNWEILCDCESKEELNEMEFHYIKQFKSNDQNLGYNMTEGGEGGNCGNQYTKSGCKSNIELYGKERAKEISDKHSKSVSGKNFWLNKISKEEKDKWCKSRSGKNNPRFGINFSHSEKTKKLMSNSHKGKKLSEDTKSKIGNANRGSKNGMYGKKVSIESIKKQIETKIKNGTNKCTEDTKSKIGNANRGSKNGNCGRYQIIIDDEIITFKGLKQYCTENNITKSELKKFKLKRLN